MIEEIEVTDFLKTCECGRGYIFREDDRHCEKCHEEHEGYVYESIKKSLSEGIKGV